MFQIPIQIYRALWSHGRGNLNNNISRYDSHC